MYCIFSTLPLDVENTVIHTMNSEGAFLVLLCLCFYGRMFEDFTDSIGSVDSFFPIFRFLINGFRFFSFFSDFVLLVSFIYVCQKSRRSWCLLMFRYMAIHRMNVLHFLHAAA